MRFALLLVACLFLTGCVTTPRRDATSALITRPDFKAAVQAAPEWVSAAMREITRLEAELEAKK